MIKITNIKFAMLAVFAGLFLTASAQAATYTVNSTADPGVGICDATECNLREAITAVNGTTENDVIEFDPVVFSTPETIILSGTELSISISNGSLIVNGTGANMLTVSGNNLSRVFSIGQLLLKARVPREGVSSCKVQH